MHQGAYINQIIEQAQMLDSRPLSVPMDQYSNLGTLEADKSDRQVMHSKPYAMLVGSLMYAAVGMRPDISFAVSLLAQVLANPMVLH
jgi:hypothetical protein